MPGFLLHVGAGVMCSHGGQAQPMMANPRVLVSGQPTITMANPYLVAGCALAAIPSPPCVSAQWTSGATKVLSNGVPLVVQASQSICTPTGTPLLILVTQIRVAAL